MTDADYEDFKNELKDFPHSFQLENYREISREKYKAILFRLQTERDSIKHPRTTMEEVRDHNFISFIYIMLNNTKLAFEENAIARSKEATNIVALANYVHMLYLEGNVEQTDDLLQKLENMKKNGDFKHRLTASKAELAYSYNRMGLRYYEKSVHFYEDVIKDVDYPEISIILVWKFGAALAIRRCYKFCRRQHEYTAKVKEYLEEIIDNACDNTLVAKSWIEMAENYNLDKMNPESVQQVTNCLEKALELCSDDAFVLERCGKFYRYLGDLDKSRQYLEKAIAIRPTAFSFEHLALTYQAFAKETQRICSNEPFSKYEQESLDSGFQSDMSFSLSGCLPADTEQVDKQMLSSPISQTNVHMVEYEASGRSQYETGGRSQYETGGRSQYDTDGRSQLNRTHSCMETSLSSTASELCQDTSCGKSTESGRPTPVGEQPNRPLSNTKIQESKLNPNAMPFYPQGHWSAIQRSQSLVETTMSSAQLGSGYITTTRSFIDVSDHPRPKSTYVKSPIVCLQLPSDDSNVEQAIKFFKESLNISGHFNQSALFHLGLINRSIGNHKIAIEYFKKIVSQQSGYKEPQQQISACEQIGLCYRDMANTDNEEENLKLSKSMLTKAIEICAKQTAGRYKTVASLPTLRSLLTEDLNNLQELARLHKLVGKYRESLEFYHRLFSEDKSLASNPKTAVSVLENFLKCKDYQNAAVFLDILMCTEDGKSLAAKKELIKKLYTESAQYYMKKRDFLSSSGCFQSQFLLRYGRLAFDKDGVWDVVLLDDPDVTNPQAECLMTLLHKVYGLETTRNTDDALGGILEVEAQADIIVRSKTVLILLGEKEMARSFSYNTTMAAEMLKRGKTSSVVLVTLDNTFIPEHLSGLPCKEYPSIECSQTLNELDPVWILDLFQKLIGDK